ncbi:DUF411 domain-containing protein [Geminocystis sp. GBBB08]|uniref:DUF411 domain-containing protein n=1 Tax=Geminocystis sp. GBBB08 TaxID=2604140 RepID=UPI0027E2B5E6|nr:DUF411 domain-containing protein [Geminocystis sp. GBBB08]MBL1210729.1 DUF411 domain-containing protein [Geminocystis sp. GBBB08]
MRQTRLLRNLTGIITITIISSIAFSFNIPSYAHENHENHENKAITASVWDKSTVNYNGSKKITVYRSPSCGCCGQWISHLKKQGFEVTDIKTDEMEAIKRKNNLPSQLESCHTAIINGYVMEGHIPADDIKRFLSQKPTNIKGLAVAGMPIGSPGMESDKIKQPFIVSSFNNQGNTKVFNTYKNY